MGSSQAAYVFAAWWACMVAGEGVPAATASLKVKNHAANTITLMQGCKKAATLSVGQEALMELSGGNKFWIAPDGFSYDCKLDCLGCFYIAANVAPSGALVSGIGYGHNDPVVVHDGVASVQLSAEREDTKQPDSVTCSTSTCDYNHIIPGFKTELDIGAATPQSAPSASLLVYNSAGNTISLMSGCSKVATLHKGGAAAIELVGPGGGKYWIVPDGFSYDCKLDCLGCFYIAHNVAPSGALVSGIGYGHNDPVVVHDGVASVQLSAEREDTKQPDSVTCSTSTCDYNHIIAGFKTELHIDGVEVLPQAFVV